MPASGGREAAVRGHCPASRWQRAPLGPATPRLAPSLHRSAAVRQARAIALPLRYLWLGGITRKMQPLADLDRGRCAGWGSVIPREGQCELLLQSGSTISNVANEPDPTRGPALCCVRSRIHPTPLSPTSRWGSKSLTKSQVPIRKHCLGSPLCGGVLDSTPQWCPPPPPNGTPQ